MANTNVIVKRLATGIGRLIPDKTYLNIRYRKVFKRSINWKEPTAYSEKLQWLKVYDRKPVYTTMVDKFEVKQYVADLIGEQYIIPTINVWDKVEDIDFDSLPDQFVLKCTHDSGGLVICTDKTQLNKEETKKKLAFCLKQNYFWSAREWPYKNVKPRIIAEKYMVDESGYELKDYKFFCFNGEPKALFIASDRQVKGESTKFDFFDMEFNHLPFINGHPNANHPIKCPPSFEKMKELAAVLSKGIPQLRVDFYDINGDIYFGELTFYHHSGFETFEPEEWDYTFGEWITLPKNENS